jgi:hypothetical protein
MLIGYGWLSWMARGGRTCQKYCFAAEEPYNATQQRKALLLRTLTNKGIPC